LGNRWEVGVSALRSALYVESCTKISKTCERSDGDMPPYRTEAMRLLTKVRCKITIAGMM
jgi:hypothetical protein